jgi:prevent-host-death family protein
MEQTMTATAARIRFGEVLRRVAEGGQRIIVERAGQPQAVIISVAEYEWLKAVRQEGWQKALERAIQVGHKIQARRGGQPLTPPEEIIRQGREERDAQLTGLR